MPKAKGGKRGQSKDIERKALALAEPIIKNGGFDLWDVVFEKEGAMWYLRILFDKEGGITDEECEAVTKPLNEIMDAESFINEVDILEIGSPGLTKRLRLPGHFEASIGKKVRAQMKDQNGKPITKIGVLSGYSEENGEVYVDDEAFKLKKIIKINLDF